MRRIEVKLVEHTSYLQQQPDRSVDIIYFDPMFRQPLEQSSASSHCVRLLMMNRCIEIAINEARRVARKAIVMKEHRHSAEFARLGFTHLSAIHNRKSPME